MVSHVVDLAAQGGGGAHLDGGDCIVGSEKTGVRQPLRNFLLVRAHQDARVRRPQTWREGRNN